jgi:O-antigen/teichoic acid export membrane protein
LLKLYFVAANADLFWFVLVSAIDQMSLAAALAYAYSKQRFAAFYFQFDKDVAKQLMISARPLIISGVMVSVYSSIDRVIIKELLGVREVGLYVAAASLTGAMSFVPTVITNSVFPALLNARQKSWETYARRMKALSISLTMFGMLVCLLITLFSDFIVHLLYGNQYGDSAGILQIYVWSFLIICFASIFSKWLLAENLHYLSFRFTAIALTINLLGNFVLIPLFSLKGAAIAAVAAQFIPFPLMMLLDKNLRKPLLELVSAR